MENYEIKYQLSKDEYSEIIKILIKKSSDFFQIFILSIISLLGGAFIVIKFGLSLRTIQPIIAGLILLSMFLAAKIFFHIIGFNKSSWQIGIVINFKDDLIEFKTEKENKQSKWNRYKKILENDKYIIIQTKNYRKMPNLIVPKKVFNSNDYYQNFLVFISKRINKKIIKI